MRVSSRPWLSGLIFGALWFSAPAIPAAAQGRLAIASNPVGTEFHLVGGGIAKLLSEKAGLQAIVQPYAGSSVYLPLIEAGEVAVGISSSLDAGGAYRGEQGRSPTPKLRALVRLWPLAYGFLVRNDSGIREVADLRGKRVVIEVRANVALSQVNRAILAVGGLGEGDVRPVTIGGLPQGIQAVVDGSADATPIGVSIPATREAHAKVPGGVRYVNLSGANASDAFLGDKVGGLFAYRVEPAPNMPDVAEPVTVAAYDIYLIVSAEMRVSEVERILRALHDHFPELQNDYPSLKRGDRAKLGLATNTVPYHPASIAYFKARGSWTEANDTRERQLGR